MGQRPQDWLVNWLDGLRRNTGDALGLFVVPALMASLPWPIAFRALKQVARHGPGFRREAEAARKGAEIHLHVGDAKTWKTRLRIARWVERVDTYLTLTRSQAWWERQVDIVGQFPVASPCLLLTFHWGAGSWIWKLLRQRGFATHLLARRPVAGDFGTSRVALWYGRMRGRFLLRIGSKGLIYTGGSGSQIRKAWEDGGSVLGMMDVPVMPTQKSMSVRLLDAQARLPCGLLQLAAAADVPVTLLSCGIDIETGRRRLWIEPLPRGLDIPEMLARYARHLEARVHAAPEAWHMWHEAGSIFVDGSRQRPDGADCIPS
jgi:hypothetical protein